LLNLGILCLLFLWLLQIISDGGFETTGSGRKRKRNSTSSSSSGGTGGPPTVPSSGNTQYRTGGIVNLFKSKKFRPLGKKADGENFFFFFCSAFSFWEADEFWRGISGNDSYDEDCDRARA
jgi:hypothetical protein